MNVIKLPICESSKKVLNGTMGTRVLMSDIIPCLSFRGDKTKGKKIFKEVCICDYPIQLYIDQYQYIGIYKGTGRITGK